MSKKTVATLGVLALWSLGVFAPPTVFAQHGPGKHAHAADPAYDTASEATFTGFAADVKAGGKASRLLSGVLSLHTLGLGHKRPRETQLLLKTSAETVQVHLGPTAFLSENKIEIRNGDSVKVTGSRITIGDSQVVLAREIRKGENTWALRDATGQPLWHLVGTEARGFWTKKRVLFLGIVAAKVLSVVLLASHG